MKKNITKTLFCVLIVCLIIPISTLFSGCMDKNDYYLSVVPTDQDYKATLSYQNQTSIGGFIMNWTVIRKSEYICNENQTVIYIEYSYQDTDDHSHDYTRILMYVNQNVLCLENNSWNSYTGSFGDKWSDIYGSYSKPTSFVYELTQKINGRAFPKKYKEVTDDYIKYDFERDNEVFNISNDAYHLLLYYSFDYEETHIRQESTINYGTPSDSILYLSTITSDMIANNE